MIFLVVTLKPTGCPACSETNSCLDQSSGVEGWGSSTSNRRVLTLQWNICLNQTIHSKSGSFNLITPNHDLSCISSGCSRVFHQTSINKMVASGFPGSGCKIVSSHNIVSLCRGAWMGIRPPIRPGAPTGRRTPPLLTTTWVLPPKVWQEVWVRVV